MNFYQAREYAVRGLHIRRAGWSNKWFSLWRGVWWYQSATETRPVETTDYAEIDLISRDWTTMPKALESCPTGGVVPPLPNIPTPQIPPSGMPGFWRQIPDEPIGDPSGGIVIPRVDLPVSSRVCRIPPAVVRVTIMSVDPLPAYAGYGTPNGTHILLPTELGGWEKVFASGEFMGDPMIYTISSHCFSGGDYYLGVSSSQSPIGGDVAKLGVPIAMDLSSHHTTGSAVLL